jgi:hypothetical protein
MAQDYKMFLAMKSHSERSEEFSMRLANPPSFSAGLSFCAFLSVFHNEHQDRRTLAKDH